MRYQDATAFRQALEQHLRDRAGGDGARLVRERKRAAFDRLLARLLAVANGQWLLKGGFALDLRLTKRARTTKDIDIEWKASEEELLDALLDAANHDASDFFVFAIERAGVPEDLFGFAGIEPVEVDAVPLELQVAEKLHAYTRTYEGGRTSTRPKDLVDLALISELSPLDAATLRREIETIFGLRDTHTAAIALPLPPAEWVPPFRRLAKEVGISSELAAGHRDAAALLDPILNGKITAGRWDPNLRRWVGAQETT